MLCFIDVNLKKFLFLWKIVFKIWICKMRDKKKNFCLFIYLNMLNNLLVFLKLFIGKKISLEIYYLNIYLNV